MKREINYDTEHCNRHLMLKDALIPSDVTCFVISQSMSSLRMLNGVARILPAFSIRIKMSPTVSIQFLFLNYNFDYI